MFVGTATRQHGQLPVETTGFIGRDAELNRLGTLLGQVRLVTVTGPGGVGKSRLALRAAAAAAAGFADGVCLVELAALSEAALLPQAVADALGIATRTCGARLEDVLGYLRDRQVLLVLDTCEHLIDACAILAEAVLAQAGRVTLLATSREPLDVSGENACPLGPLPVPDIGDGCGGPLPQPRGGDAERAWEAVRQEGAGSAVDLFLQRAAAAVPGFAAAPDELPDVIRVCRRLDGIPLAIELAAVRLRALPLGELAERVDQRLALLTSGQRGGRHRTLRDTIGWSYDLCTPEERAMWARLSVFAGPFTMSAAEEVCAGGPGDDVMPTVVRLVDKSVIVKIVPAGRPSAGPTEYRMLATIREFGAERLRRSGDAHATRTRFVARYLRMARQFRDHFLDDDQLTRMGELRREHANVRAALRQALGEDGTGQSGGVELAIALALYWRARGLAREGAYWLGRAAELAPEGSAPRARAVLERGRLLVMRGEPAGALADATRAIALAAPLGDEALAAEGYLVKAAALCGKGRLAAAAEAGDEALRRLTALDDQLGLATLEEQLAYLALLNNDAGTALSHVERGLRRLTDSRESALHAHLYMLAALTLYLSNRDIESAWAASRALQVTDEVGDLLGIAFMLELLGWLAARSGSYQRAAWLLGGADPLWERAGGRLAAAASLERLHGETVAHCGSELGGKLFAELFARGVRHPMEAMIAFARSDVGDPAQDGDGTRIRLPSQLTAREQEIAGLVAAGLSNRQIAETLFISRRTVDAHLEHIFDKLSITSRVMLTIQLREYSAVPGGEANT